MLSDAAIDTVVYNFVTAWWVFVLCDSGRASVRASDQASVRASDQASVRASVRASERTSWRASVRANVPPACVLAFVLCDAAPARRWCEEKGG